MKYAVLTACLNAAGTIQKTISSVMEQTIAPAEYVFVDGGSTDGTLQIVAETIEKNTTSGNTKFQLIHQNTKGGIYEAWNLGLKRLQSEVIFILSADDWYFPHTAEEVLRQFSLHDSTGIVCASGLYYKDLNDSNPSVSHNRPLFVIPFAMPIIHPACFVRRDVYKKIGFFDASFRVSGDYEFIYRCLKRKVSFTYYQRELVHVLHGGFSEKNKKIARIETYKAAKKHSAFPLFPSIAYYARCLFGR